MLSRVARNHLHLRRLVLCGVRVDGAVAGSAYTYAYATLGELCAWIIGWDLVLEYAVGGATVANGWSGYFQSVLAKFNLHFPAALSGPPIVYDTSAGHFVQTAGVVNLPAILIVTLVTVVLVKGIQESATFNATMVFLKVTVVLFVILVGAFYIDPENWSPFAPYGMTGVSFFGHTLFGQVNAGGQPVGMVAGAAIIFFAYIGFDSVSTHAEEAKQPKRDVPIGIIASLLICTVLYIAVVAVLTGMVPHDKLSVDAGVSDASSRQAYPGRSSSSRRPAWPDHVGAARAHALRSPRVPGHGAGRDGRPSFLRGRPSEVPHAVEIDDPDRNLRGHVDRLPADRRAAAPHQHRYPVRLLHRVRGGAHHAPHEP